MTPLSAALPVGLRAVFVRRVTPEMVQAFADLVGDHDPIHLDAAFCRATPYGRPIAHGALLIGFMSAALAGQLRPAAA